MMIQKISLDYSTSGVCVHVSMSVVDNCIRITIGKTAPYFKIYRVGVKILACDHKACS